MKVVLDRMLILLQKELIQLLKDPKTRMMLFLPPVIQLLVFGYVATMDLKEVRFAVLDHCRSAESRELIAKFNDNAIFKIQPPLQNETQIADRLASRDIKLTLVIPHNFAADRMTGGNPVVHVSVDGRNSISAGTAIGYAQSIISNFNRDNDFRQPPVTIQSRAWYNPNFMAHYFMVPSLLAILSSLDVLLLAALCIVKEREAGTFDQLCLTPFSSLEILTGKLFSVMVVGICQLTSGLAVILFWFKVPFYSSFFLLYLLFFAFIISATGLGLLISILSRSLQQAMLLAFVYAIPAAMLSGLLSPVESMPEIFQKITIINPVQHGVSALQLLFLEGTTLKVLSPVLIALLTTGAAFFALSCLIFDRQRKK